MAGIFNKNRVAFHDWLMGLTMALTPRTQTLIYTYETPDDSYSMDWFADTKTVMQALKTLSLRGASGSDYYLFDVHPLLTAAPNLETFYALDCGGNMIASSIFPFLDVLDGEPWMRNLAVGKVRKMVLDEVYKAVFEKLMQRCAELEDLVYYLHSWYDCPDITRAFAQMETRLKKLCFGFLPPPLLTGYESLLEDEDYGNITPVTSPREFTQLEDLVLDQALLSRQPDGSTDTRLETLLPPSIRSVYFTYVYKTMYVDLMHLASAAPGSLPKLRTVKIGLVTPIPSERVREIEHMKMVEGAFASVGVRVSWEENLLGPFLYTAVPGGTPGLTVTCVPAAPLTFP